jgi:hypothetical protein
MLLNFRRTRTRAKYPSVIPPTGAPPPPSEPIFAVYVFTYILTLFLDKSTRQHVNTCVFGILFIHKTVTYKQRNKTLNSSDNDANYFVKGMQGSKYTPGFTAPELWDARYVCV